MAIWQKYDAFIICSICEKEAMFFNQIALGKKALPTAWQRR
jgi:hypothetical protein